MEAMTVMGMAASQARFLGLTARKSNVEYQGQQVNQARTTLATESSNLYSQMMELNVPTPPSSKDYMKTSYVLEGSSGDDYGAEDFYIQNMTKTYNKNNEYSITLARTAYELAETTSKKTVQYKSSTTKTEGSTTTTYDNFSYGSGTTLSMIHGSDSLVMATYKNKGNSTTTIEEGLIYSLAASNDLDPTKLEGYNTIKSKEDSKDKIVAFYQKNGKNYFLTSSQIQAIQNVYGNRNATDGKASADLTTHYTYDKPKTETVQAIGIMESSDDGRNSSLAITSCDKDKDVTTRTYALTMKEVFDENGYNDAMNDYEYLKGEYEKSIDDINAQTEQIQAEDRQLEIRLQQLDTEQSAISTEMDSVTKVIDDNIEKTFKVFA